MIPSVNERYTVSPFLLFVIIQSMQFGLRILFMAIKPIELAGQDAWISVLLSAFSIHLVIWMMYRILNHNKTDLIQIHKLFFGKWAGNALNLFFILYYLLNAAHQIRYFIEVIQVWVFPDIETWILALVLLLLVYYIIAGGFRVIVGICLLSFVNTFLFLFMLFTAPYFHFHHLLPILNHSPGEILEASRALTFSYAGVEILFFCYTFIKTPQKSEKWAHLANISITILYLAEIIFSLLLFKQEQLSTEIWPGLTKYQFVQFPFIERFEFIGASATLFRLFPIVCLCIWASSRIMKYTFSVKQSKVLPFFLLAVFVAVCLIPNRIGIQFVQRWLENIGLHLIYLYIPFLFIFDLIRTKARKTA